MAKKKAQAAKTAKPAKSGAASIGKAAKQSATVQVKRTAKKIAKKEKAPQEPILMQTLRGMRDLLPADQEYWNQIRKVTTR